VRDVPLQTLLPKTLNSPGRQPFGLGQMVELEQVLAWGCSHISLKNRQGKRLVNETETILLAEDEPMVRAIVATTLRDQDYTILEATNGVEALQVAQEHTAAGIQLLISNIVMPQMDGIELATRFRGLFPDAKILLITGYIDEPNIQQAVSDTSIEFLLKPVTPQALVQKVREVLSN
jgi:CheY-like chemotaxis protein